MLALPLDVGAVEWVDGGGEATVLLPECSLDFSAGAFGISFALSRLFDGHLSAGRSVGRCLYYVFSIRSRLNSA